MTALAFFHTPCSILAGKYNVRITLRLLPMFTKNVTFTTLSNWERYCDSGDNRFLDDAATIAQLSTSTRVVIAGEGWEREVVLA